MKFSERSRTGDSGQCVGLRLKRSKPVRFRRRDFLEGRRPPDPERFIIADRGKRSSVWREGDTVNVAAVTNEGGHFLTGSNIPQANRGIERTDGQRFAIGREGRQVSLSGTRVEHRRIRRSVHVLKIRTDPALPPAAMVLPSGDAAIAAMLRDSVHSMPSKAATFRQLLVSHALIVLAVFPAVRSSVPCHANCSGAHSSSGVENTLTSRFCSASRIATLVAAESRRLTVIDFPSGEIADATSGAPASRLPVSTRVTGARTTVQ